MLFLVAHCFKGKGQAKVLPATSVYALFGLQNLDISREPGSVKRSIQEIIVHRDWDYESINYDADISVLVLNEAVKFTNRIRTFCLPVQRQSDMDFCGIRTVAGFELAVNPEGLKSTRTQLDLPAATRLHS